MLYCVLLLTGSSYHTTTLTGYVINLNLYHCTLDVLWSRPTYLLSDYEYMKANSGYVTLPYHVHTCNRKIKMLNNKNKLVSAGSMSLLPTAGD